MSKQAMQQALDHLVNLQPIFGNGLLDDTQLRFIEPHIDKAIAALEAELAKPEQAPVAYLYHDGSRPDAIPTDMMGTVVISRTRIGHYKNETPLYTSPPHKEWIGLTDDEICDLADYDVMVFTHAVIAKLKEKNAPSN